MLSKEEFYKAVADNLYPKAREIENELLELFNKKYILGRGETGLTGSDEIDFTIGLLQSSINFLKKLKETV